jgi:signal transduction protein with GAF and PtsI domain
MQLIVTLSETTNKRLDEALGAVNKRLDDTTKRLDDMKNDMRARVNHVYDLIVNEHAMPTLRAEYVHVIMPALAASRAGRR